VIALLQSWPLWLALVVASFAAHEGWALATGNQPLTSWVRTTTKRFPIAIFFLGVLVGWFAQHLWGGMPCVS
jgi:hypothetical protein